MTQEQRTQLLSIAEHYQECIFLGLITLKHGCNLIVSKIVETLGKTTSDEINSILSEFGLPLFGLEENYEIYKVICY